MSSDSYLDEVVVSELKELLEDGFSGLVAAYLSDARDNLDKIKKAFEANDLASLSKVAHTLKGSSANVGARSMSELCQELYAISNDSTRKEELHNLIINSDEVFRHVEAALNDCL